jgi:hypothetical protein
VHGNHSTTKTHPCNLIFLKINIYGRQKNASPERWFPEDSLESVNMLSYNGKGTLLL